MQVVVSTPSLGSRRSCALFEVKSPTSGNLSKEKSNSSHLPRGRTILTQWISWAFFVQILLTFALRSQSAPGDILSASIETNGWVLDVAIQGLTNSPGASGQYNFGLGTNNTLTSNPTVMVSVISMGFDDTGAPIVVPRTVYGTFALRFPYPNQSTKDQVVVNGVLTNKIVLSDYVFARDSNAVVQIQTGYYTDQAGFSNGAATLAAQNGSVLAYQRPIANWTWPGWERITGNTYQVRAAGFHQSAQMGRPVRLMRFIASDAHGHILTNDVLNMTVDRTVGDQLPFGEYIGIIPTTTLAEGDIVTNTFQAYPWVGDRPLDSGDGVNLQPTPYYSPLYILNDKTGQYGSMIAVVAPSGSDMSGSAVDSGFFSSNAPPAAFATIAGAASAIEASNRLVHARDDVGGGIIYLRSGSYSWLGASRNYGQTANCYLEVTTFPGDIQAVISGGSGLGADSVGGKVKLTNLKINSSTTITFAGEMNLWIDQCTINSTSAAFIYNMGLWYVTRCNVLQLPQGIFPYSIQDSPPVLVRGNATSVACFAYTVCGNIFSGPIPGSCLATDPSTKTIPQGDGSIIFNNAFYRLSSQIGTCYEVYFDSLTNGVAFVQNLVICATNGSYQFVVISGESATNALCNNVIFWNNDVLGRNCDLAYNNNGTAPLPRVFWSVKNNLFDKLDIKTDTGTDPNGGRTGDWSEVFGVSYSGNFNANITGVGATTSFNPEFMGLNSFQPAQAGSPADFFQFADGEAFNGTTPGNGLGDYHLSHNSPVFFLPNEWLLSFDLAGNQRQSGNAAGVYAALLPMAVLAGEAMPSPGRFQFVVSNLVVGMTYQVQSSSDLIIWRSLCTNTALAPSFSFTNRAPEGSGSLFYRVMESVQVQ